MSLLRRVLQQMFPYISPVKTALVGGHYGGFLSIYALAKDPASTFGCSVAISPISSWNMMGTFLLVSVSELTTVKDLHWTVLFGSCALRRAFPGFAQRST